MSKDIVSIEVERHELDMLYGVLLKARASEASEKDRLTRLSAAYNDRSWANNPDSFTPRIVFLTALIEQVDSVR